MFRKDPFKLGIGWAIGMIAISAYMILGMMIGSFYAIVMGPTTLHVQQAPLGLGNFQLIAMIVGLALVLGMQWFKERSEKQKD